MAGTHAPLDGLKREPGAPGLSKRDDAIVAA
jgi:hypothetical protein